MRLIDADALNPDDIPCYYGSSCYTEDVEAWLNDAPTIDAVPVVRCKDCWNATKMGGFMGEVLYCPIWERNTDDECFCSYGERKDGEG